MQLFLAELLGNVLQKADKFAGRFDQQGTSSSGGTGADVGILDDAATLEESGILVESQTNLQDLHFDEIEFKEQTQETTSCKGEGAFA